MIFFRRLIVKILSKIHCGARRRAHRTFCEGTWEKVWPNDERGPDGLYLLYRTNGYSPCLEPIIRDCKSVVLWCN